MPTSPTLRNQLNSLHSTGPVTEAGKARSSQNALKHGLASGQLLIRGESREEFDSLLSGLLDEHKPVGITELLLVQDMAKHSWLKDRAMRLQADLFSDPDFALDTAKLSVFLRYQTSNERGFARAFSLLRTLQKERQADENKISSPALAIAAGFVSQFPVEALPQTPKVDSIWQKYPLPGAAK